MRAEISTPLRDGLLVAVAAATPGDAGEIAPLLAAAGDPRCESFASAHEGRDGSAALVARAIDGRALVGYAAWRAGTSADLDRADFFCAVDPSLHGLGLGTLLLRRAATAAEDGGLRALRVALDPRARALAAMLRDCGLSSRWDLEHPLANVEVLLGAPRPGWATP